MAKRQTTVIAEMAGHTDLALKLRVQFKPTMVNPPKEIWLPKSKAIGIRQFATIGAKRYICFKVEDDFLRFANINPSQLKEPYSRTQMSQITEFKKQLTTVVKVGIPKIALKNSAINPNHVASIYKSLALITEEEGRPFPSSNFKNITEIYNRGARAYKSIKSHR